MDVELKKSQKKQESAFIKENLNLEIEMVNFISNSYLTPPIRLSILYFIFYTSKFSKN